MEEYLDCSYRSRQGFLGGSVVKKSACSGEGNGNPLQYCCRENPMDKGAWQATVHAVTKVGHDLLTKPPPPTKGCEETSGGDGYIYCFDYSCGFMDVCACVLVTQCVQPFATPWTVACQAPLSMEFSRQKFWSG